MPRSTNPERVLLYGRDRALLDIRALVLKSARLDVDIATDIDTFKKRITDPAEAPFGAVICCYTTPASECAEVVALAARSETPVLQLDCLVQPVSLIEQVRALLPGQR
jgi:hypothetical protein